MTKNSSGRANRRRRDTKDVENYSRITEVSAAIQKMYEDSKSEEQITDTDVHDLIGHISNLLQLCQGKTGETSDSHSELSHRFWPGVKDKFSSIMKKFTDSKSLIVAKEVGQVAIRIFERIKNSNEVLTTACLIVSYILDGIQNVSDNKKECLGLLGEVIKLAQNVNNVKLYCASKETKIDTSMKTEIDRTTKKTITVILEVSILCCNQKKACMIVKFLKAEDYKKELSTLQRKVEREFTHINTLILTLNLLKPNENYYTPHPDEDVDIYPDNAVGIDEPKKKILKLLDWKRNKSIVSVIVYGTGGMGKSTLANAVYSKFPDKKNCKCIRVVVDINPLPESIKVLQKNMIQDLMGADKPLRDYTSLTEGRRQLGRILQDQAAFIYIDNVSEVGNLRAFLPCEAWLQKKESKLRLLITTRDRSIATVLPKMSRYYHDMGHLDDKNAMALVRQEIGGEKIESTVLEEIVKKCKGVPLYLILRAKFIATAEDKEKAYEIVREESNNCGGTGPQFGGTPVAEIIGYSNLPSDLKDAFLDICSYFQGYDWHEVEDIMGVTILDKLEQRCLVRKDANYVTVHDDLLELGTRMSKETRIKGAREFSRCLNAERNKDSQPIKGLWFSQDKDGKDRDPIPAKKLEPVSSFLRVLRLNNFAKTIADYDSEITFPKLIYLKAGANPLPFKVCLFEELKYLSYSPRNPDELKLEMPSSLKRLRLNGVFYPLEYKDCQVKLEGLQNLRSLTLCNFKQLQKLPKELSSITYLKFLEIINCPKLQNLPEDFGSLTCLEVLDLKGTCLKNLPENFSQLKGLKKLNLSRCRKLQDLCTNFEGLPRLEYLMLKWCPMLEAKWMGVIVKMKKKTIKDVDITGSEMLLQEWRRMGSPNLQLETGNV